jgi:acyl-CoA synthetase (AMP-forming)/AMP-acid ligase II
MSVAAPLPAEILSSLSLPELVEYRMRHDPMHAITLFPGKTANHRPSRITYLEFGRAVQRFAQIIALNPVLKRGKIVGLMADCDALLYITAIAGFAHGGITVSSKLICSSWI